MKLKITAAMLLALLTAIASAHAERRGPAGSASQTVGPQGGTTVEGTRNIQGARASSTFGASGPQGRGPSIRKV